MPVSSFIECDVAVIGTGMAGTAAALFAANRGRSTVIVGRTGEIIFASGFLDLFGVHPLEKKRCWKDPWAGINAMLKDMPNHPYGRLTRTAIAESVDEYIQFMKASGLSYRRRPNRNAMVITPMGTVKPTYGVPNSMWNGVSALENRVPCLIVGIAGLKGFSARLIAENLRNVWPGLRPARVAYSESDRTCELFAEQIAQDLELAENRERLARLIHPSLRDARAVGMPAICGLYQTEDVFLDLEKRIGVPLFEIPTMPPSIPGLRIKSALERRLPETGVRAFFHKSVLKARHEPTSGFVLDIGTMTPEHTVHAHAVILASGRFLGRGLHADRKRIRETLFDLPVSQPSDRASWHRDTFLDPRGHPINQAGLKIDDQFRPLNVSGFPVYETLFAAGSILASQDWMRQKCGAGLAIASAYASVNACLKLTGESSARNEVRHD